MKLFNNLFIQITIGAFQIYVGLGFFEIVPGFTAGGAFGKVIGAIFIGARAYLVQSYF